MVDMRRSIEAGREIHLFPSHKIHQDDDVQSIPFKYKRKTGKQGKKIHKFVVHDHYTH